MENDLLPILPELSKLEKIEADLRNHAEQPIHKEAARQLNERLRSTFKSILEFETHRKQYDAIKVELNQRRSELRNSHDPDAARVAWEAEKLLVRGCELYQAEKKTFQTISDNFDKDFMKGGVWNRQRSAGFKTPFPDQNWFNNLKNSSNNPISEIISTFNAAHSQFKATEKQIEELRGAEVGRYAPRENDRNAAKEALNSAGEISTYSDDWVVKTGGKDRNRSSEIRKIDSALPQFIRAAARYNKYHEAMLEQLNASGVSVRRLLTLEDSHRSSYKALDDAHKNLSDAVLGWENKPGKSGKRKQSEAGDKLRQVVDAAKLEIGETGQALEKLRSALATVRERVQKDSLERHRNALAKRPDSPASISDSFGSSERVGLLSERNTDRRYAPPPVHGYGAPSTSASSPQESIIKRKFSRLKR